MAEPARGRQGTPLFVGLRVERRDADAGVILVALSGVCDFDTAPQLDGYLRRTFGPLYFRRHLLLDLEGVQMIDSAFVSFLVTLVGNLRAARKELVIARPRDHVRRVVSIVGLANIVPVYDSLEEAEAALRGARKPLIPPAFEAPPAVAGPTKGTLGGTKEGAAARHRAAARRPGGRSR